VAAPAVLADVVDYGSLRFGADYAGTYFSFYLLMYKAVPQVGAAAGLALVGLFGFDPQLAEQTSLARWGLLFTFSLLPALLLLIAAPLIWYFPINARRQRIITQRLQATRRRHALQAPDIHGENKPVVV
jgi:Na+/melibiose symporter-like transporter